MYVPLAAPESTTNDPEADPPDMWQMGVGFSNVGLLLLTEQEGPSIGAKLLPAK
jgi:hypothetical protein